MTTGPLWVKLAFSCCNTYRDSMSGKLQRELHKSRPFDSLHQETFLSVVRTADHLMRAFEDLLRPHGLSPTQYNVLRILRGMCCGGDGGSGSATESPTHPQQADGHSGVPCKAIGEHMLTRDPDITRLLDRLESRALITRQRDTRDRRIVSTRITAEGLRILRELDKPVAEFHRRQFVHMPENKLAQLIDLLELARSAE